MVQMPTSWPSATTTIEPRPLSRMSVIAATKLVSGGHSRIGAWAMCPTNTASETGSIMALSLRRQGRNCPIVGRLSYPTAAMDTTPS